MVPDPLVPWIPRPKLIPERDGMYGASGDVHVRPEVSRACCGLRFVLEALWRICRVYIYLHLRAELLQLAGVVTRYVAVRGPGARLAWAGRQDIPGRTSVGEHQGRTHHKRRDTQKTAE